MYHYKIGWNTIANCSEVLEEDDEEYKSERENKAHLNRIRDKMYATQLASRAAYMSVPFKERKVQDVPKSERNIMSSNKHC